MFDRQLAEVWDLLYGKGKGKDYQAESQTVARIVLDRVPHAASVLDVGCGTGEHLVTLAKSFDHVEGVDISEHMVAIARAKLPEVAFHVADMRELALGRTFDAVISLFTVVGYLPSLEAVTTALRCMVDHLAPGGVLVVEPWWFTEKYLDGYIAGDVVHGDGCTVSRVSRTTREGDRARMDIHYVVADSDGIRHFTETHSFGLWSRQEYLQAFADAGCEAEYLEDVLYSGLFVARRRH